MASSIRVIGQQPTAPSTPTHTHDTSSTDNSPSSAPTTPRRGNTNGGFVPMSTAKLQQLQLQQQQQQQQLPRPTSSSTAARHAPSRSIDYASSRRASQGGPLPPDILTEVNGPSTIRRVQQQPAVSHAALETPKASNSALPLSRPRSMIATPSSSGSSVPRPSSALSRMRLTTTSMATPSSVPFRAPPPPQTPSATSSFSHAPIAEESASSPSSSGFSLGKIRAKITDASRSTKKLAPIQGRYASSTSRVRPDDYITSGDIETDGDESAEDGWDMVNRQARDDAFWEDEASSEQESVKVSVRVRPLNPLSINDENAWEATHNSLRVMDGMGKRGGRDEWVFDNVVSGSDNKEIYDTAARDHVRSAMEGYNSVVFAYGQTASGKTFTLTGSKSEPGVISRAIEDVFTYIRKNPHREFLLRASYLEIYNEVIKDLLEPSTTSVEVRGSSGNDITLHPVHVEVVRNPAMVREILTRGEANRRTAQTDWNERSSRSHSIFRLVIESSERGAEGMMDAMTGRTPMGKARKNAKATRTSTLSLIDLAGSEKATSDKLRSAEGKYINTSLLALKQVIATIAKNETKGENAHVSYRNSKLTRMLQPSLSGDSKVSVICTLNPSAQALPETYSTLNFATGLKAVKLTATKKEIIGDPHALIEQYQVEIAQLRAQLREKDVPRDSSRRLSRREEQNISQYKDRIRDLSSLILTSANLEEDGDGSSARPVSPTKIDIDATGPELHRDLFQARIQLDEQAVRIEQLEEELKERPVLGPNASESEKDALIRRLTKENASLKITVEGHEANLRAPFRKVYEDVVKEWEPKVEHWQKKEAQARMYGDELKKTLDRETVAHKKLKEVHQRLIELAKQAQLGTSASTTSLAAVAENGRPPSPSPSTSSLRLTGSEINRIDSFAGDGEELLGVQFGRQLLQGDESSSWDLTGREFK